TAIYTLSLHDALPICHSLCSCYILPCFVPEKHRASDERFLGIQRADADAYQLEVQPALDQIFFLEVEEVAVGYELDESLFLDCRSEEHTSELQSRSDL